MYSLDLTTSESPVWSTALVFLNMKYLTGQFSQSGARTPPLEYNA
jgi:hypothetical protein